MNDFYRTKLSFDVSDLYNQKWTIINIVVLLSFVVIFFYSILEFKYIWTWRSYIACAIYILLVFVFFIEKKVSSVLLLIQYAIAAIMPDVYSQFFFLGTNMAIAYIGERWCQSHSALVFLGLIIIQLISVLAYNDPWVFFITLAVPVFLSYSMGICVRLISKREKFLYNKQIDDARKRYARLIHDSVTGELSVIALLSQQALVDQNSNKCQDILEISKKALSNVRIILSSMNDADESGGNINLELFLQEEDNILHKLGFKGSSKIEGRWRETSSFSMEKILKEVYSNIVRHCSPDGEYSVLINIEANSIDIIQSNSLLNKHHDLQSGKGLIYLSNYVYKLSGNISFGKHDDKWYLLINIPTI